MDMQPSINVVDEYNATPGGGAPADNEPAEGEMDIAVTAEQMTAMKQLAADQKFEELGRMVAPLLTQTM